MLHRDVLPNTLDNHSILEWRVADLAARAALSLSLADIGKACLQIDTGDVYLLLNNVGPVWKLMTSGTVPKMFFGAACSDETTALTTGTNKIIFHAPANMVNLEIFAGLSTPQGAGSTFTVDVNKNGSTILSTKVTIDNTEETSLTAAAAAVLTSTTLTKGDKLAIDIDQIGDGSAKGLKVYFRGDAS